MISFLCLFHSVVVYKYFYPRTFYAVDTVLCFVFGFYWSFFKKTFDKIIMKNDICYFATTTIFIFIYYKFCLKENILDISIKNALFSILVIIISIKVKVNNEFLTNLNSHSFSIYLLQRLVFWIVYRKRIFINCNFIQVSFEFTTIFFIASIFDKYTYFIDRFFKKTKKIDNIIIIIIPLIISNNI